MDNTNPNYYSAKWHVDGSGKDIAKVFVFLHDTDIDQGPTCIASKSQSRALLKAGYKIRKDSEKGVAEAEQLEKNPENIMVGVNGDVFYFDPNYCIHKAGVPSTGCHRDMLMIIAVPAALNRIEVLRG